MPTETVLARTLNQLFLGQLNPDAEDDPILASPDKILVINALIVSALIQAKLPYFSPKQRQRMVGQLTPGVRELILAVIQLLTDHPDIAAEAGVDAAAFDTIAKTDVELENIGSTLNDLVVSVSLAEGQTRAALLGLNNQALLTVGQMLGELDAAEDRQGHDALLSRFRAAINKQSALSADRAQTGAGKDKAPSLKQLRDELDQVEGDSAVQTALSAIRAAAPLQKARVAGALNE